MAKKIIMGNELYMISVVFRQLIIYGVSYCYFLERWQINLIKLKYRL